MCFTTQQDGSSPGTSDRERTRKKGQDPPPQPPLAQPPARSPSAGQGCVTPWRCCAAGLPAGERQHCGGPGAVTPFPLSLPPPAPLLQTQHDREQNFRGSVTQPTEPKRTETSGLPPKRSRPGLGLPLLALPPPAVAAQGVPPTPTRGPSPPRSPRPPSHGSPRPSTATRLEKHAGNPEFPGWSPSLPTGERGDEVASMQPRRGPALRKEALGAPSPSSRLSTRRGGEGSPERRLWVPGPPPPA